MATVAAFSVRRTLLAWPAAPQTLGLIPLSSAVAVAACRRWPSWSVPLTSWRLCAAISASVAVVRCDGVVGCVPLQPTVALHVVVTTAHNYSSNTSATRLNCARSRLVGSWCCAVLCCGIVCTHVTTAVAVFPVQRLVSHVFDNAGVDASQSGAVHHIVPAPAQFKCEYRTRWPPTASTFCGTASHGCVPHPPDRSKMEFSCGSPWLRRSDVQRSRGSGASSVVGAGATAWGLHPVRPPNMRWHGKVLPVRHCPLQADIANACLDAFVRRCDVRRMRVCVAMRVWLCVRCCCGCVSVAVAVAVWLCVWLCVWHVLRRPGVTHIVTAPWCVVLCRSRTRASLGHTTPALAIAPLCRFTQSRCVLCPTKMARLTP